MDPQESLERLLSGLERSRSEKRSFGSGIDQRRRLELENYQHPHAIILTCSDSRVVPEYIFDAGLGDIFVCRSAGNAVNEYILGSIELAAKLTGCSLLLVLGHTGCAAVRVALSTHPVSITDESKNISAVIDSIKHSISPSIVSLHADDVRSLEELAVFQNVINTCHLIGENSLIIKNLVSSNEFMIAGAVYDTVSGRVEFLD